MKVDAVVEKCLSNIDFTSENKAVRQFLQCVVSELGLKYVVVDNGLRYNFLVYLEVETREKLDEVFKTLQEAIESFAGKAPESVAKYIRDRTVVEWPGERYILFGKEYVIVKHVVK